MIRDPDVEEGMRALYRHVMDPRERSDSEVHMAQAIEITRNSYTSNAPMLIGYLRRPGPAARGQEELFARAGDRFIAQYVIACGGSRDGRSMHVEAATAFRKHQEGLPVSDSDPWARRWGIAGPMLREQISLAIADKSRPAHVMAELIAMRTFHGSAMQGVFPMQAPEMGPLQGG